MSPAATSPDGIELRYATTGAGSPAIVFVHGWSCDRTYWREQMDAFGARHEVVAIDLAGHGESGTGRVAWTMPAFGDDVVAVVDRLGLERVILVGHSMGGDVVVEAALRLGDRVAGVVWVDTYRTLEEVSTAEELEAFVAPFRLDFRARTRRFVAGMFPPTADPVLAEWIAEDMASAPPDIAIDALAHAMGNDGPILGALDRLDAPVVAINPDDEPTDVGSLRRHGVETVLVRGTGHFPMLEDPAQFNRVLAEVVATLAAPPGLSLRSVRLDRRHVGDLGIHPVPGRLAADGDRALAHGGAQAVRRHVRVQGLRATRADHVGLVEDAHGAVVPDDPIELAPRGQVLVVSGSRVAGQVVE